MNSHTRKDVVVYTAIFGGKDFLRDPTNKSNLCDYICFTDNHLIDSNVYNIVLTPGLFKDPVRSSKIYKVLPHCYLGKYRYSLWIDGNAIIKKFDIELFIKRFLRNYDAAFFQHPNRDCIYDELTACVKQNKDDRTIMESQIDHYKSYGYPTHNGLIAGGIILRSHNTEIMRKVNEDWWQEIVNHSGRDQLSFNYVAWKHNFQYSIINGYLWDNEYFRFDKHLY